MKRNGVTIHVTAWTNLKNMLSEMPNTKCYILYDYIYMKYPEYPNSWRQKAVSGSLGLGAEGHWGVTDNVYGVSFGDVLELDNTDGCTTL